MFKLFLTIRYLWRRRIAYFAVAAVALCTMMVLIVSSVMGGFLDKIKAKARGLLGDVVVQGRSTRGFPLYDKFIAEIGTWPEVVAASPVIFGIGVLGYKESTYIEPVQVTGIRLEEIYRVNAFKPSLFYEKHYPGSTTLGEQAQPVMGFDRDGRFRSKRDSSVEIATLPDELRAALEAARKAGVSDNESLDDRADEQLRAEGMDPIPGYYLMNPETDPPEPGYIGDRRPGVIIGRDLIAKRMKDGRYERYVPRGRMAILTLVPVTDDGSIETPVKQPLRYSDDSRTGIFEIDSKTVYCDFELLQKQLLMDEAERTDGEGKIPARCSQIQIRIKPGVDARALCERMEKLYKSYMTDPNCGLDSYDRNLIHALTVQTWEESQAHFIAPVEKERILVTILFAIISLVAAVLVMCILYMIVLQKTRDIGIIKSLGASSAGVGAIFMMYALAVGIVGATIGGIAGYWFVVKINEIQAFLIRVNPAWQMWDRSVYSFDEIPNTVRTTELIAIVIAGILMSVVGSVAAAIRAARMEPVDSLRYE